MFEVRCLKFRLKVAGLPLLGKKEITRAYIGNNTCYDLDSAYLVL
jgi:hypothetical protein